MESVTANALGVELMGNGIVVGERLCPRWKAVSKQATCGSVEKSLRIDLIGARLCG